MDKVELEALLEEFDSDLAKVFPGPEPMRVLVVGGRAYSFRMSLPGKRKTWK